MAAKKAKKTVETMFEVWDMEPDGSRADLLETFPSQAKAEKYAEKLAKDMVDDCVDGCCGFVSIFQVAPIVHFRPNIPERPKVDVIKEVV